MMAKRAEITETFQRTEEEEEKVGFLGFSRTKHYRVQYDPVLSEMCAANVSLSFGSAELAAHLHGNVSVAGKNVHIRGSQRHVVDETEASKFRLINYREVRNTTVTTEPVHAVISGDTFTSYVDHLHLTDVE